MTSALPEPDSPGPSSARFGVGPPPFSLHVARKLEGAIQAEAAFLLPFPGCPFGSFGAHRYPTLKEGSHGGNG